MKHARFFLLLLVMVAVALPLRALAQNSPYPPPKGNVGTWSWGKTHPQPTEEGDEEAEEAGEREPGETSWERMQAGRPPEELAPPQGEILKSISPLSWWRWWRGEKHDDSEESAHDTTAPDREDTEE